MKPLVLAYWIAIGDFSSTGLFFSLRSSLA
jgi:hypothetical protein